MQTLEVTSQAAARPIGKPWPVDDLAAHLSCSSRHIWRLIHGRKIRSIRVGARVLVPDAEARRVEAEGV